MSHVWHCACCRQVLDKLIASKTQLVDDILQFLSGPENSEINSLSHNRLNRFSDSALCLCQLYRYLMCCVLLQTSRMPHATVMTYDRVLSRTIKNGDYMILLGSVFVSLQRWRSRVRWQIKHWTFGLILGTPYCSGWRQSRHLYIYNGWIGETKPPHFGIQARKISVWITNDSKANKLSSKAI